MGLCSWQARIGESIANLNPLHRLHRHHRQRESRFEAFVPLHETSEANRYMQGNDFKYPTKRIFAVDGLLNLSTHSICERSMGTTHILFLGMAKALFIRHITKVSLYIAD